MLLADVQQMTLDLVPQSLDRSGRRKFFHSLSHILSESVGEAPLPPEALNARHVFLGRYEIEQGALDQLLGAAAQLGAEHLAYLNWVEGAPPSFASPQVIEDATVALEAALEQWQQGPTKFATLLAVILPNGLARRRTTVALDDAAISHPGYFDWDDLETSETPDNPTFVATVIREAIGLARDPEFGRSRATRTS